MYWGLSRTLCDTLEEMRTCSKTLNFSYLNSLIEEAQSMANRMEASLADSNELEHLHKKIKEKRKELEDLKEKIGGVDDPK